MDFEQMKVIWDQQNEEPLYAVNEAGLHAIVRRRSDEVHQCAASCYRREIIMGALFGVLAIVAAGILAWGDPAWLASFRMINVAVTRWDVAGLALAGGIMLYYAAYMWTARQRQLGREEDFASSLRGDLDRALAHVEFLERMARRALWRGLVPCFIAAGLWITVQFHLKNAPAPHLIVAGVIMAIAFGISIWVVRRAITRRFTPSRQELESLRNKLDDQQP